MDPTAAFETGLGVVVTLIAVLGLRSKSGKVLYGLAMLVGVALVAYGAYGMLRSDVSAATTATYSAPILNCVEDLRIAQKRTYQRNYLPTHVVYIANPTDYQINASYPSAYAPDGSLFQLSDRFALCTLQNTAASI